MQIDIKVNPAFLPYLRDYSHRFSVYWGGRGSGKSYFLADKLVIKALEDKRRILFLRKYGVDIKDSAWLLITDALSKFGILPYCKVNLSTQTIKMPNGSVLLFRGLDNPERAKGLQNITDIWIDESNQLTYEEFDALDKSLRHTTAQGQEIILSFNPVSKTNWVYQYWFADGDKPNTFYHHSTYRDNKFLPQPYIDSLKQLRETNPTLYAIVAEGQFASLDKLVYSNFVVMDFEHSDINGTYIYGLDFGYTNDETAFICVKVDTEHKTIYIFEEFYEKGKTNDGIAQMIKYRGYSKEVIIADSSEPKSIEEIKRHGILRIKGAVKGAGSVNQGIQQIQQYKLVVHPSCTNTITELQSYSWKKDRSTGEYTNQPQDSFNHLLDALRYAMQTINAGGKLKTMPKSIFGF